MLDKIHIAFCTDNNYVSYTGVAITSIILNNLHRAICVHIFFINIDDDNKDKLMRLHQKYKNITIKLYDLTNRCEIDGYKINHYYTKAVYLRWYISEIIDPQISRILYLDGDILCLGDIGELYNFEFPPSERYPVAAVGKIQRESEIIRLRLSQSKVINAGVLLISLQEWRQKKISERLFKYADRHHDDLIWLDNDVMNSVLDGDFYLLDEKWNHRIYIKKMNNFCILPDDVIIHYSGEYKPWNYKYSNPNKEVWWEYANKSLWFFSNEEKMN